MRIISGKARGTKLYTLDGLETRPTLDRVKESLFNIINDRIYDSSVLDLFSGSGAIGLEFISRGAKEAVLCDNSKKAIDIIRKNAEKTHLEDKVEIYNLNFEKMIEKLKNKKFDFIFLDPPYKTNHIKDAIKLIKQYNILNENGMIIAETDEVEKAKTQLYELNANILDIRKYGRIYLIFIL